LIQLSHKKTLRCLLNIARSADRLVCTL